MTENHEKFLALLDESQPAVEAVAKWLVNHGAKVKVAPLKRAPTAKDWEQYSDNGDMQIQWPNQDEWLRVEVKHRKLHFTSQEDFKYPDMIVCSKHSFDRAGKKPRAYLILNEDMTCLAIIKTKTSNHWTVREVKDKNFGNGYTQVKYLCPKEFIRFLPFTTKE